jgi:hypothetical protein
MAFGKEKMPGKRNSQSDLSGEVITYNYIFAKKN